jgi:hypothetical protein
MWDTTNLWFDVALVTSIFAVGNILFGHFVEHQPKLRRVTKVVLVTATFVTLSATVGRAWALLFLSLLLAAAAWVHVWWLPKHGVNGWTGEPRARYLELVRRKPPRASRES